MICQRCNEKLDFSGGERVGFRDVCESCGEDLHVCLNCVHHDPVAYNACRESSAERVSDPEVSNRCEYFSAHQNASTKPSGQTNNGKANPLDTLFKTE